MNQLSTPELDDVHSGTGAVSLTSEGAYSEGFLQGRWEKAAR